MEHGKYDYKPMITETQRITDKVHKGSKDIKRQRVKVNKRKRNKRVMDGFLIAGVVLSACLAVFAVALVSYLHGFDGGKEYEDVATLKQEVEFIEEVRDFDAPKSAVMPVYLQDDVQWGAIPYGKGTISNSGCGLVCASMAIEYLTGVRMNPDDLQSIVKDTCLTDGVNDPGKFVRYAMDAHKLSGTDIYYEPRTAIDELKDGALVFASVNGNLGVARYDGHIVLLWKYADGADDGYLVHYRDPKNGENSITPLTQEQFRNVNWVYFYSLRGESNGS